MATEVSPGNREEDASKANASPANVPRERVTPVNVKQEEGESSKLTSPMPPPAPSPTVPIMTNSDPSRPPSATSAHSNTSTAPRTTTTSRRGGRTRARSPPVMINRTGSSGPPPDAYAPADESRGAAPPSPANPSAAAAAAAAAAKSITRNPPPPSSWYDSPERGREYGRRPHRERYHPSSSRYYEQHHRNWPSQEEEPPSRSTGRYRGRGGEEHYSYREGGVYYRERSSRAGDQYPPYDESREYSRRYPEQSRGHPPYDDQRMGRRDRTNSPHAYQYRGSREHHHRVHPRNDPYYKKESEGSRTEAGAPAPLKRTTRVIGTATPIHVPRASDPSSRSSRVGSAASVFRGRPGSDMRPSSRGEPPVEDDGQQKILMALRTPSTSFEEKPPKNAQNGRTPNKSDPLSPEEPPRIQHSHHQSATESSLFFEPHRSPKTSSPTGVPQPSGSIDMAPSFSLFNQSFDSIGDTANFFNVGGPLDSALQSNSFGAPIGGDEKGTELQLSSSNGNFSQQILGGSSSGGNLTFGMSPNNSFGVGASSLRSGNMMVLGGQDQRSSSPSQVLDMYRSYSGGEPSPSSKGGALEDSHHRSPGQNRTQGFGDAPNGQYRSNSLGPQENLDGSPTFYNFLRKHKEAFKECSFLMPGLKSALLEAPTVKSEMDAEETPKRQTRSDPYGEVNPHDTAIAIRRVASAVSAFGGTRVSARSLTPQKAKSSQSIFRDKASESITVTPGSSPGQSQQRTKYNDALPTRYYENDNRLSWEFEENPPIEEGNEEDEDEVVKAEADDKSKSEVDVVRENGASDSASLATSESGKKTPTQGSGGSDQPKMRYRCKLCGQPKQNHNCPYRQSLARSIGTMVYPAVNAFTSAEPGTLAPALSEMNNFILAGSESVSSNEASPSRPTPDRMHRLNQSITTSSAQVTPESLRGTVRGAASPISSGSTSSPQRTRTPGASTRRMRGQGMGSRYTPGSSSRKKRSHSQMNGAEDQGDLLFVESVDLKPEQFRIVSQSKVVNEPDAFSYPALPLPYAQRKRLSDNLFSLSKEVPQLTDECAAVLREAREKDLWDLAVAELMAQVVVVVHCQDGDSRFDGLRRYLLTLGISC